MKNLLIISLLVAIAATGFAQTPSPYSSIGFGLPNEYKSVRNIGLSGTALTLDDPDYVNIENPAGLTQLELTKIEAFATLNGVFSSDNTLKKYYSSGEFGGFSFSFPVSKKYGIGFLAGITPYSNAKYDLKFEDNSNPAVGTVSKDVSLRGGLSTIFISSSYIPFYDIKFGLGYKYYFGNTRFAISERFSNAEFTEAHITTSYEEHGSGFSIGAISPDYQFGVFDKIRLGLTIDSKFWLKSDSMLTRTSALVNDTISRVQGANKIPLKLVVGLSFRFANVYRGLIEYASHDWSSATGYRITVNSARAYRRFSTGIEYRPIKENNFDFNKSVFRAGFSYEQLPISILGTGINQITVSAGASFSLSYQNHIDLALAYGTRGSLDVGQIKESFLRFSLGLSFGELWFVQQER